MSTGQAQYFPIYFAPDLDPSWEMNPGVLIDVTDAIPTRRKTFKTYVAASGGNVTSLGSYEESSFGAPVAAQMVKNIKAVAGVTTSAEPVIGTTRRLLSISSVGPAFYDASSGGADYSSATCWTFTTFGNNVIACSKANAVQTSVISDGSMAFTALAGAPPKAKCCTTQKNFVLLGDTDDGTNDLGDRVWWSALGDDTSWTASAATQAGNYRLLDTPGPICALVNMRDSVIAYKEDSIYVGEYQGSPLLWTWRVVSDGVGCSSPHGVAVINGIHYFLHRTGVYRFDGAAVQPVGFQVAHYLATEFGGQKQYGFVQAAHEESENCIYWFFGQSTASTNVRDRALVWNYATGAFGFVKNAVAASGSEGMRCVLPATLTDFGWSWDSTLASAKTNLLLLVTTDTSGGTVKLRLPSFGTDATGTTMTVVTGDIGGATNNTTINRVTPRYLTPSSASALTFYRKPAGGSAFDAGTSATADSTNQRFDGLGSARYFKLSLDSTAAELGGLTIYGRQAGTE